MSHVSRRKLLGSSSGSRDNLTLHRWVLLKNLVVASSPPASTTSSAPLAADEHAAAAAPLFEYSSPAAEQEVFVFPDADIFEFPDADSLTPPEGVADEAAWLEALLDELDEDDDDDFDVVDEADDDGPTPQQQHFPGPVSYSSALSAPAPPARVTSPADVALSLPLFPASPSSSTSTASSLSPDPVSALSTCNCITPPPTPSSSPRTPSLFGDLPFGDYDGADDTSDDESEGPDTPLTLSSFQPSAHAVEPAVILPDSEDSYSYFFRPLIIRSSPLAPSSTEPFPLHEC
jgi:hypothetical protein